MEMYILYGLLVVNIILVATLLLRKSASSDNSKLEMLISRLEGALREEMSVSRQESARLFAGMREEQSTRMTGFEGSILTRIGQLSEMQLKQLSENARNNNESISQLTRSVEQRIDSLRESVDKKLGEIQRDNAEKIETMRQTVDEKLHKTLEQRLGESFKTVSERLEQVHKGLGEMHSLAEDVGGLKKVLSNVKTRGIMGEIQLGAILEQILSHTQYESNVVTKPGSREVVEYAVKLPGHDDDGCVYLPIDSKFPLESYERLLSAYDAGDLAAVELATRELEGAIKKCAKDIKEKYIYPPNTTDFGVLFLPVEGLYAEVLRRSGLVEMLMRDLKIIITGPTTLAALLSSLQMGFKTLAIEKRSSEVWNILASVKTEFSKFGDVLESTQKRIVQAGDDLDKLVGTRTRQIMRQLRNVNSDEAPILPAFEEDEE